MKEILRFFNTVRYLKPKQIFYQVLKGRILKSHPKITSLLNKANYEHKLYIEDLDSSSDYLERFNVTEISQGKVTFINIAIRVNWDNWEHDTALPLWEFNLHYFEFLIAIANMYNNTKNEHYYNEIKKMISSWVFFHGDYIGAAWHPYTISLRVPNWLIALELCGDVYLDDLEFRDIVEKSIWTQYLVLESRIEYWLLGNHYFENLKCLLICSMFFNEKGRLEKYYKLFIKELSEQILKDGFHYELSPMYHKIILEDLLRLYVCMGQIYPDYQSALIPHIEKMSTALNSLESNFDRTPLFNDSADNVAKSKTDLLNAVKNLCRLEPRQLPSLPEAGYYMLQASDLALIFDAGLAGPDYMVGHAHCDCLSFELSYKEVPLFVNSGTYLYQGAERAYFRSTEAHNTVMVDERQQSDCWGEHRVGKRLHNVQVKELTDSVKASFTSYLGDTFERHISLNDQVLQVMDHIKSKTGKLGRSFLRIPESFSVISNDSCVEVYLDQVLVCRIFPINSSFQIHHSGDRVRYSPNMGELSCSKCIEFSWKIDNETHGYRVEFNCKDI